MASFAKVADGDLRLARGGPVAPLYPLIGDRIGDRFGVCVLLYIAS